uniref:Uncharacterized protein n=1 Tax=Fusarium oxysporum (strain Fo5176) TaxID=660025 RepID=A0A0D2YDS9_FUSOF
MKEFTRSSAEHAWLPQFQKDGFFVAPDDGLERRPDLKAGDSYYASSVENDNPAGRKIVKKTILKKRSISDIILTPAGNPSGPGEAERQPAIKRAFL